VDEKGLAENKEFLVALHIQDRFLAHGTGPTKKEAQQNAAKQALGILTSK
jgi:dsRNA-specific ribonuclease